VAQVYVKYNPYRLRTQIGVNGHKIETDSTLYKIVKGKRMQEKEPGRWKKRLALMVLLVIVLAAAGGAAGFFVQQHLDMLVAEREAVEAMVHTKAVALTEYSKWLFGESDSLDVNLYAVFVKNEIVIDITEVSGTQWKILGNYYIAYAEGISEQIANSAQVECSVAVTYYAHGKKLFGSSFSYDEIGKANFSEMSGSLNKTGMNCGNAVGGKNLRGSVKISASFSCGGIALGSTSEFEQFKDKS